MGIARSNTRYLFIYLSEFLMFAAFDLQFFENKLQNVELEWSEKMYLRLGIVVLKK